jgi:regulation of enolase protein 1 (concanavalin A-like superfamily)
VNKAKGKRQRAKASLRTPANAFAIFAFTFCLLPFALYLPAQAGAVRTLDGNTYIGDVRLDTGGMIVVTPADGSGIKKIDLSEVLHATVGNPSAAATAVPAAAKTAAAAAPYHTENSQIPTPWTATDIGALSEKGYAKFTNEGQVFSIKSAGGNIGAADDDAFCFVNQPVTGDFELLARTTTVADPKVTQGLMLRAGPDPGAAYVAIFYVAGDIRFFKRTRTNEATQAGTVGAARSPLPVTMRLTRRADTITAAWSRDGATWQPLGSQSLPMRPGALAGVACCGRGKQLLGAHVSNLRLTTLAPVAAAPEAETAAPQSIKEGLTFRSGTHLAAAQIQQADDASLTFVKGDRKATLSLASVARIVYRELTPEMAAKIPEQRTGVLLNEGDFVEGAFKGLRQGKIELSSILFGIARFDLRDKPLALILNDFDASARPKLILRTRDGSAYVAKNYAPEKDTLIIEDPLAGQFTINRTEVTEISAGPGRLESLTLLKPEKIDPPTRDNAPSLSIDSTGLGLAMTLAGSVPAQHGLTLSAGATASWNLGKQYRTFTFKCGIPNGILPTAPIRFIVLADGKELYKSPPQTSLDDPLSASLSVKGISTLTLKVESAMPLPTPGLWADPALVK